MADRIIYVPGTWDLFHYGHTRLLYEASKLGDWLVAGINWDEWVKRTKGRLPVMNVTERAEVVAACRWVNEVITTAEPLAEGTIELVHPAIIVMGTDWLGKHLKGLDGLKAHVVYLPYTKDISTSRIIARIEHETTN
jgi:cytidyltransferase-like protein